MNTALDQSGDNHPSKPEAKASLSLVKPAASDTGKLDEKYYGRPIRTHLKEFGALFAAIGFAITASFIWHNRDLTAVSCLAAASIAIATLGYLSPSPLYPLWKGWMKIGELLGMVMSFVVLGLIWVTMFVPLGMGLKAFGKKTMEVGFDKNAASYWISRDPAEDDFKLLNRQY